MPKIIIKTVLIICAVLILTFALWFGFVVSRHYTIPILMYHYINDEEPLRSRLGVSPKSFQRQMRFLKEHNYNVVTLDKITDLIKYKKRIPPKTIAITFDDGYIDNYANAYPILKKYNIPATIFVVINRIGKRLGQDEYMGWPQIEELSNSGLITVGSHSISHPNLSEVASEDKLRDEIFASKRILEETLHKKVDFFSYPFGGVNSRARGLTIEAGYKACVGTNFPKDYPGDDIYALKRLRISENSKNLFIFWVETSGFYTYIKEHRDDY
jgi:peptidoglycan/xylan/chitin deacetylase (PgdA/CDA1 family)